MFLFILVLEGVMVDSRARPGLAGGGGTAVAQDHHARGGVTWWRDSHAKPGPAGEGGVAATQGRGTRAVRDLGRLEERA